MKLEELYEEAAPGVTSVSSIGKLEYSATPNTVKLYKRDCDNKTKCIAKIRRKKNEGWRFMTMPHWKSMNLPHFGQLHNARTPVKGMKTISGNLDKVLKQWGIKYDELKSKSE